MLSTFSTTSLCALILLLKTSEISKRTCPASRSTCTPSLIVTENFSVPPSILPTNTASASLKASGGSRKRQLHASALSGDRRKRAKIVTILFVIFHRIEQQRLSFEPTCWMRNCAMRVGAAEILPSHLPKYFAPRQ